MNRGETVAPYLQAKEAGTASVADSRRCPAGSQPSCSTQTAELRFKALNWRLWPFQCLNEDRLPVLDPEVGIVAVELVAAAIEITD
jgi:hypothetical protein